MHAYPYLATSLQRLSPEWQHFLIHSGYLANLDQQLSYIAQTTIIYPPASQTFRALETACPIKVVILGQDPYHGAGEANGLAFAVNPGIKPPPSLRNIFKELILEYPLAATTTLESSLLSSWSQQGVLLLNCSLSVIKDQANSLAHIGWHQLSDKIIRQISDTSPACVFMLWGSFARSKKNLINSSRHLILEAVHPSPLAAYRGFFGCNHFKRANQFLQQQQLLAINWLE